jgi:hypothetical protein
MAQMLSAGYGEGSVFVLVYLGGVVFRAILKVPTWTERTTVSSQLEG